jgi:peptidyl-prolyl cis-trans isomerase C
MTNKRMATALVGICVAAAIAALALGAKPESDATGKADADEEARKSLPVAKIDGEPMTLGYFESTAQRQSPLLRKELDDATKRKEFLDKLLNMELLAAEAKRRGYHDHEEVRTVLKNQLASLMHRRIADEIKEVEATEDSMRKYYDEHIENYKKPEKVRARHILISDKSKAEQLLEDEATRLRGGDMTFFPRPGERRDDDPEVEPEVAEAAFKIKENGDIFPQLVKSSKGFHLVMRTGHRQKMDLTFDDAKDRLTLLVKREQRKDAVEAAIDGLKERFPVDLREENLKDVVIDLSGGPPEPNAKGGLTKKERKEKKGEVEKQREAEKTKKK